MKQDRQVLALGFFDGVHLGHRALLESCVELARSLKATPAALTFDVHPLRLLQGEGPGLLCTLQERERLLRQGGMERVYILPFDEKTMRMDWQDYFRMLVGEYGAVGIVCGDDHRFGYKGQGTAALLERACVRSGIACRIVPQQALGEVRISSSHIRQLLAQGQMEETARFLGRPYSLEGVVVHGKQLGRTLGTPTANLTLPRELAQPRLGVYAARVWVDGTAFASVTNIGTRPTVSGQGITVESWLPDFQGDLYGQVLRVELRHFLRPEEKFPSLEALQKAIHADAQKVRQLL